MLLTILVLGCGVVSAGIPFLGYLAVVDTNNIFQMTVLRKYLWFRKYLWHTKTLIVGTACD